MPASALAGMGRRVGNSGVRSRSVRSRSKCPPMLVQTAVNACRPDGTNNLTTPRRASSGVARGWAGCFGTIPERPDRSAEFSDSTRSALLLDQNREVVCHETGHRSVVFNGDELYLHRLADKRGQVETLERVATASLQVRECP